jgi:hypothetical protein
MLSDNLLMDHARHFERTIHAMCAVHALLNNGILYISELAHVTEESFTQEYVIFLLPFFCDERNALRELREYRVFRELLYAAPGLERRLMEGSNAQIVHIAELVRDFFSP